MSTGEESTKRMDDAVTIDFLMGAASALISAGAIEQQVTDKFRLNLTDLQYGDLAKKPLLYHLHDRNDELVKYLSMRYGALNLWRNLTRYSLKRELEDLKQALSLFGKELLGKAQLMFNRPHAIYLANRKERRILFSGLIIDYAELVYFTCEQLNKSNEMLSHFLGSDLSQRTEQEKSLDEVVAKNLAFATVDDEYLLFAKEAIVRDQIVSSLNSFCHATQEVLEQMQQNKPKDDLSKLTVIYDALKSQAQALSGFQFPKTYDVDALEARRLDLLIQVKGLTKQIASLHAGFIKAIHATSGQELNSSIENAENIIRTVASVMMRKGISSHMAEEASRGLVAYCDKHNVTPDKIIAPEVSKIHASLNMEALDAYKTLCLGNHVGASSTDEKQQTLHKSERLSKFFASMLTVSVVLLGVSTFCLQGCGVKTALHNELIDYRPAVAYHAKPRPAAASTGATEADRTGEPSKATPVGPMSIQRKPNNPLPK